MATLRVKSAFACSYHGVEEVFAVDRLVDSSDPVVKGREHLFETVEVTASRQSGVEAATAAPGEKRSLNLAPEKKVLKKTQAKKES